MDIQSLIKRFRKQIEDIEQPYLVDDDEALDFVIDAQDTFVRRMGGFSDYSTAALTDVALVADTPTSVISPYILRIRSAKLLTALRAIAVINEADISRFSISDYGFQSQEYMNDDDTGEVVAAILGVEENKVRWWRVPDTADTMRMHIYRLPYPRISVQEDDLEIEEQHHFHLIKWMKHLAYSKPDAEIYDKNLAALNKTLFEEYCDTAKAEKERKVFKPRIVHYGGI